MVGGGNRKDDGPLKIGSTNVFAALETLKKKKKKSDKEQGISKNKGSSKVQVKETDQTFWAATPLAVKSWADVDDEDDDDYYATTAPPKPVWGTSEQQQSKLENIVAVEEESESEDDGIDMGDDDVEEEPEHESTIAAPAYPIIRRPPPLPLVPKESERQLSKKELKKKGLAELDAVLAELGITKKDNNLGPDEENGEKNLELNGESEKKEATLGAAEGKASKKKKAKKATPKEVNETDTAATEEAAGAEPDVDASSGVDVKERLKKVATMKKKKSIKEMDTAAKAAALEAAARTAKLAAAKKKEKNHYNQQPVR